MKIKSPLCALFLFLIAATVFAAQPETSSKVLIIVREHSYYPELMVEKEVNVMTSILKKAGCSVVTATESGTTIGGSKVSLKPDLRISEVRPSEYCGVMVPCMASGLPGQVTAKAVAIVKTIAELGRPVAAQNGGVYILEKAGVLVGKKYAMESALLPSGKYVGQGVVQDGNVVTSGSCPYRATYKGATDGTVELTKKFVALLPKPG